VVKWRGVRAREVLPTHTIRTTTKKPGTVSPESINTHYLHEKENSNHYPHIKEIDLKWMAN
jgi:hypothetical protein